MSPANVLVDARYGRMLVNQNDVYVGGSFVHCGEFSEHEVRAFRSLVFPGDVVLDVGANIGAHTVPFAQIVGETGRVYAFEPQPYQFHLLCANLALNDLFNVETLCVALGASTGQSTVQRLDPRARQNFGGLALGAQGEPVARLTVDALNLPAVDFLKVDVEGMELDVLQGAGRTIATHRPTLYVEADRPEKREALAGYVLSRGYTIYWHLPPLWNDDNQAGATECPWPEGKHVVSINWLCLPDDEEPPALDYLKPL